MGRRVVRTEGPDATAACAAVGPIPGSRRAYYRVTASLPIRLQPLAPAAVDAAIYDLTLPIPGSEAERREGDEASALMARLRRIEEKLDRLLGAAEATTSRPLSGADRRRVVFSGAGLALDVDFDFRAGDAYRVELLVPAPQARLVRAVAEAVADAVASAGAAGGMRRLALVFRHIEPGDRDALVAYSYEIQRLELRTRIGAAAAVA